MFFAALVNSALQFCNSYEFEEARKLTLRDNMYYLYQNMYVYIYSKNCITNASKCFDFSALSSGNLYIVFDEVIKH